MYDLIGDIHGHADELAELLARLGYERHAGVWRHGERRAIFLGDFIDRGPQIAEVLDIVRPMVEGGQAQAILGNHELNALAYHTPDALRPGEFLRPHIAKNTRQHEATLRQLNAAQIGAALAWFRTLPVWLELDGLRAIHACWSPCALATLGSALGDSRLLRDELLPAATQPAGALFAEFELLLKGREALLPSGWSVTDKDGHPRETMRTRWFAQPQGQTYRQYALQVEPLDCDLPLSAEICAAAEPYPAEGPPVFVGHYWLRASQPGLLASNVACLDYSVARGGLLCAYRWHGERALDERNFVWVPAREH